MYCPSKNYDRTIQKIKLEIGTFFGCEKDSEVFIVLKEPLTMDMMRLSSVDTGSPIEIMNYFKDIFPHIIVDHNFYRDEDGVEKMSNNEITELLWERFDLTNHVFSEYTAKCHSFSGSKTGSADTKSSN